MLRHIRIAVALSLSAASAIAQEAALQILRESCAPCHNDKMQSAKLRLDSLDAIAAGGDHGPVVMPGNSAASALIIRAIATDNALRMPPAGERLSNDKVATLRAWIDAGAPGLPKLASAVGEVDYGKDVEPVLKKNCYSCHAGAQPKSQLRLDKKPTAMRGGVGGVAIVPGNAESSRLIARVEGRGGEPRMPLASTALSAREIAILRTWIDKGAVWPSNDTESADQLLQKHWSYRRVERPAIPAVSSATANAIDNFIVARLDADKLKPSAPASRERLLRRVSLDLTGLPPTPAEVAAFVADQRPDAYDRVVDRLLASPAYGERWARPWLDAARYADTNGFEKDLRRSVWKYRDWVINALNRDLPFNQFTIEQLAGDLLPNPTIEQRIATGFHRNTMYNEEGGVDKDEAQFEVLVDRVNTTATVWLGSTIGCSQCHNHKYDPFMQREYYQLMAFFSNGKKIEEEYGDTSVKYREPTLDLATPDQEAKRNEIKARIAELESRLKTQTPALDKEQADWEREIGRTDKTWRVADVTAALAANGSTLTKQGPGTLLASGPNPIRETYTVDFKSGLERVGALRIEVLPHESLPRGGPGRDVYGNFIVSTIEAELDGKPVEFVRALADDGRLNDTRRRQIWSIDASRDEKRLPRQIVLVLKSPLKLKRDQVLRLKIAQNSDFLGQSIGHFRVSSSDAKDPAMTVKPRAAHRPILAKAVAQRTADEKKRLSDYFRSTAPSLAASRDELREQKNALDKLGIVTALVMEEANAEHPSDYVRTRGGFSAKADKVMAGVPAALGSLAPGEPVNRLTLARWLVSRDNPLTARVFVNRVWEQYFGRGIVETTEDFGAQGARPTHPELLDWLAAEFMESGWSMKKLHRTIVMSSTYRQTSQVTPELLRVDPYNRLYARGPRFRLEAEMIRDLGLAASGLLSAKLGGPSVFPPQPPGVWDLPYNDDKWEVSTGEDRYRRGLYTFVRRSAMYPSMLNFDATSREVCNVRRIRTATPLQALTTLNDEAFFEMAKALGTRIAKEGGTSDRSRVDFGYRLVTARAARGNELDRALTWLDRERKYFAANPAEASKLAAGASNASEQAAWTMFANVLLNLDEALNKE